MPSQLTTSRAYWNLRAEQVMDRVFHEQDNHLTSARVHVHESLKAKPPQWQTLTLTGLATAGLISSVWLAHNWQASQAQLDRERNLLVMERLRKLPAASRTTSEEPSNSSSISAQNTNAELAVLPQTPLDPDWVQSLEPVIVPIREETFSSHSSHLQGNASEVPVLVGVVHGPKGSSSAIFQLKQTSASAKPGENIGSSNWRLDSVNANGAVINSQGQQRQLNIGGAF